MEKYVNLVQHVIMDNLLLTVVLVGILALVRIVKHVELTITYQFSVHVLGIMSAHQPLHVLQDSM
jgi:hypothetical protein